MRLAEKLDWKGLRHNPSCLRVAGKFVEVSGVAGTLPNGMVQDVM